MELNFSQNGINIVFEITEENNVALKHFSAAPYEDKPEINDVYLISDIKVSGGLTDGQFGAKHVGETEQKSLKYKEHRCSENEFGSKLEFLLANDKLEVVAHYQFYNGISALRAWKTVKNISSEAVGLEYVPSFSYVGLHRENMKLQIPHNSWCSEADWEEFTPEQLGMKGYRFQTTKRISISNTDACSGKEYLPMGALQSESDALIWQIENNGSWHWEISDVASELYLKISGPTEQENCWYKELAPGESFESVKACICTGRDFNETLEALTEYRRKIFINNEANSGLPVIFNDYLHCLVADPTEEKMLPLIDRAAELGCEYYCMDAGWYADGGWWDTVGEWKQNEKRFPNGIKHVFDYIKSKGMKPGIWLEIEVMGINCPMVSSFEDECFFVRHGKKVVHRGRYHLDFRNEKVRRFANETLRRVIEEYGAEYIKFDYNIMPGAGTEIDADSFGDGLLQHNRAYLDWLREMKAAYPNVIFENCSSGGMRMDYAMLSEHHIQSVTDQEEVENITHIAASVPTAVLPEQGGIWVCPQKKDTYDEIAENVANGLLQRLYLSGEIADLDEKGLQLVKDGIALHKSIRGEIAKSVPFYPLGLNKHDGSVLCTGFKYPDCKRILLSCFEKDTREITVPVEFSSAKIIYPTDTRAEASKKDERLSVIIPAECTSVVVELV